MGINNRFLFGIIAVAFVGGLFSAVYAGPMIPMITFAGDTHTTGDAQIDGNLGIGINDATNNDVIKFDDGIKSLQWDNNHDAFVFNDDRLHVGTNDGTNDDFLCMDGPGQCTEALQWDESPGRFRISDTLALDFDLIVSNFPVSRDMTIFFGSDLVESLKWDDTEERFEISDDLEIQGSLDCNGCVDSIDISNNAVTSTDIADNTITSTDIADNTVTGNDISDLVGAITVVEEGIILCANDCSNTVILRSATNSFCALNTVLFSDIDSSFEDASCSVHISGGNWVMQATSDDDAVAHCGAYCIVWD